MSLLFEAVSVVKVSSSIKKKSLNKLVRTYIGNKNRNSCRVTFYWLVFFCLFVCLFFGWKFASNEHIVANFLIRAAEIWFLLFVQLALVKKIDCSAQLFHIICTRLSSCEPIPTSPHPSPQLCLWSKCPATNHLYCQKVACFIEMLRWLELVIIQESQDICYLLSRRFPLILF